MGVCLFALGLLAWTGVEVWRARTVEPPEPLRVEELLYALDWMPSAAPTTGERPLQSGPIDVDGLDSAGWVRWGLSPRQAASALRYRDAVGGFKDRSVLARMRVLPEGWLQRHGEDLVFPEPHTERKESRSRGKRPDPASQAGEAGDRTDAPAKTSAPLTVDLNRADSLELLAVRGVGPWVAGRILTARRRWGGFHSTDQLAMALGWDSLAAALAPKFRCRPEEVVRRCPDTLDAAGWSALPGIQWRVGEMLARTVAHHGLSEGVLERSGVLDSAEWATIWPYLAPTPCGTGIPSRN